MLRTRHRLLELSALSSRRSYTNRLLFQKRAGRNPKHLTGQVGMTYLYLTINKADRKFSNASHFSDAPQFRSFTVNHSPLPSLVRSRRIISLNVNGRAPRRP